MQAIEFIQAANRIMKLFPEDLLQKTIEIPIEATIESIKMDDLLGVIDMLNSISARFANNATTINKDKDALQVIKKFELESILGEEYLNLLSRYILGGKEDKPDVWHTLLEIRDKWRTLKNCIDPIRILTTPEGLEKEELPKDIISIIIHSNNDRILTIEDLTKTLNMLYDLYSKFCLIYQKQKAPRLKVINADGGSSVRIDFRGLGEVVFHLKEFILEAWYKFRHKRIDEVIEKNRAAISSFKAIAEINALINTGAITEEDAEKMKQQMVQSVVILFENGAIIPEINAIEITDNIKLLESFNPKLLTAPEKKVSGKNKTKKGKSVKKPKPGKAKKPVKRKSLKR